MATEIERKFLIDEKTLPQLQGLLQQREGAGVRMVQGYIDTTGHTVVRVRRAGNGAYLTIKGPGSDDGTTRAEFEYPLPVEDAESILGNLCGERIVEKTRYRLEVGQHIWEVDVFDGLNAGLLLAEVELQCSDETVSLPAWAGREVTGDAAYYNSQLAKNPYSHWSA